MIHVLYTYLNETQHEALLKKYTDDCTIDFRQRLLKFRRWQDQQASLLGRVLLENGIKEVYHCEVPKITLGKYGKPFFERSNIQFNITHSQHLVICAITANHEIGIDVEYQKPIDLSDFRFQMTDKEWQWISTAENPEASFYEYWTKKEAIIKAVGKGFSANLKSFEIIASKNEVLFEQINWKLKMLQINPDYICHLALNKVKQIELQEFQEVMNNR